MPGTDDVDAVSSQLRAGATLVPCEDDQEPIALGDEEEDCGADAPVEHLTFAPGAG